MKLVLNNNNNKIILYIGLTFIVITKKYIYVKFLILKCNININMLVHTVLNKLIWPAPSVTFVPLN